MNNQEDVEMDTLKSLECKDIQAFRPKISPVGALLIN